MNEPDLSGLPDWAQAAQRTYNERVEMLILALTHKHQRVPLMAFLSNPQPIGFFSTASLMGVTDRVPPQPMAELAVYGARAWEAWAAGIDPDHAVVGMCSTPQAVSVALLRRGQNYIANTGEMAVGSKDRP